MSRFRQLGRYLSRDSGLSLEGFEASEQIIEILRSHLRVLVVGAGGLGCEILKDLALLGFGNIDVIDMDTIDLSNLNRQFLFRQKDVGRPKAEVASEFIMSRVPGVTVTPHCCRIEEKTETFYRQFQLIVTGLDSVPARRWMNAMIFSLLKYDENNEIIPATIRPMIDGGTEGFKGNARIICPTQTACLECNLDLYPPQVNYPLCTIASVPRQPEHCIEWARILAWQEDSPFADQPVDGDNPEHIMWIMNKAKARADSFDIESSVIDFRKTQGVVKRIIPAVASTNAIIAAQCSTEAFKLATSCFDNMDNYTFFNQTDQVVSYTYPANKKEDCLVCGQTRKIIKISKLKTLSDLIDRLKEDNDLAAPALTASIDGLEKTLFLEQIESTRVNLERQMTELGLVDGHEISVSDKTYVTPVTVQLKFDV